MALLPHIVDFFVYGTLAGMAFWLISIIVAGVVRGIFAIVVEALQLLGIVRRQRT